MDTKKKNIVPPRGWKPGGFPVADALRRLGINDSVEVPKKHWSSITSVADSIGIRVATRSLGSSDTVTVFRVE